MREGPPAGGASGVGLLPPTFQARLLGELDLRVDGEPVARVESPRARSLLGYVLLHPGDAHARQHLAFLMWPDSNESQARTNLRNVLHTMRRAAPQLEMLLDVTPRTVRVRADGGWWIDTEEFCAAADLVDTAEPGSDELVARARAALSLYRGDLLEGSYDEWLLPERERLRDRRLSVLHRLTEALADRGDHVEATRLARELVRADPLNEDAHRLLMGVHDAAGDRAGAVRAYHQCAAVLERELGVEPCAATREAYRALVVAESSASDGHRSTGDGIRPAPAPPSSATVADRNAERRPEAPVEASLIGRGKEWARLAGCWREAEAGRSQLVVVTGEAGVGKTRLVEELAAWCGRRGAVVASARSYPTEGDLGYGTVTSWLRSPGVAEAVHRAAPTDQAELSRLLPELGSPDRVLAAEGDEAERRRRLFDAIVRGLLASGRPTLLVADDAQWADANSLQLIHYLVRQAGAGPLLVVATLRREELDHGHPLTGLVAGLQIMGRSSEIALGRLDRLDTAALVRRLGGVHLDDARIDALFAETEGNPLFIVESMRAAQAGGGEVATLSPRLHAVIAARLQQLSEPAQALLAIAAAVGREFTAGLVGRAAEVDEVTLVRALDELWRRGVIREHRGDAYDFSHGKIRDVAYDSLSPVLRHRAHRLVATALQAAGETELDALSGQIAAHHERAGEEAEAIRWHVRAAGHAMRLHATAEAVRILDRAHELVRSMSGEARLRAELDVLSALAAALVGVEGFGSDRLSAVQQRAVEVGARLGVELDPPVPRSLVLSKLCRDEFDEALGAAGRLRDLAMRTGDHGLDIESSYLLGITAFWSGDFWSGDFASARACFEDVAARSDPAERGEHLLRFGHDPEVVCVSRLANTLWFLGLVDDARATASRALELAERVGHPYSIDVTNVFAAMLAIDLGDVDAVGRVAAALSTPGDHATPIRIKAEVLAGYADVAAGRTGPGIERMRSALVACGPRNHAPGFRATIMRALVGALCLAGDIDAELTAVNEALALPGSRIWEPELRRVHAEALASAGAGVAEVSAELDRAAAVAMAQGSLGPLQAIEATRAHLSGVG